MADESTQKEQAEAQREESPAAEAQPTAESILSATDAAAVAQVKSTSRSRSRSVSAGIAYVLATFNNTVVTITDARGNVVSWSTAGRSGFKGSRKSTAFAGTMVGQDAARQAVAKGMHEVEVRMQGPGSGRESAVRAFQTAGLSVTAIRDVTPMPHNGCRPRKKRRV